MAKNKKPGAGGSTLGKLHDQHKTMMSQHKELLEALGGDGELAKAIKDTATNSTKAEDAGTKKQTKTLHDTLNQVFIWSKLAAITMGEVNRAIRQSLDYQKLALGRGLDLNKLIQSTTDPGRANLGGLEGTGFANLLEIGFDQFESGMRSNNLATNRLALYTKLTGGNQKKLLTQLAKVTVGMNVSTEQESRLTDSMLHLSQNFHMTTEELAGAIESLGEEMRTFKLLGIGPEVTEAGMAIGAAMGKAGAPFGTKFLAQMLSADGLITATMLGVNQERLNILNREGDAATNTIRLVERAGKMASQQLEAMTAGGMDRAIAIKMLDKTMGKGMGDAALVWNQIKAQGDKAGISGEEQLKRTIEQIEQQKKFTATWDNFKSVIWGPFTETLTKLMGGVLDLYNRYPKVIGALGRLVVALGLLAAAFTAIKIGKGISGLASLPKLLGAGGGAAGAATGVASMGGALGILAKGAVGIGVIWALSHALPPFADAIAKLEGVGGDNIVKMAFALGVMGAAIFGLGKLMAGPGAAIFTAGLLALGGVVLAVMLPAAIAIGIAGEGLKHLEGVLTKITKAGTLKAVWSLARGMAAVGDGLKVITENKSGIGDLETLSNLISLDLKQANADQISPIVKALKNVEEKLETINTTGQEGNSNMQRYTTMQESSNHRLGVAGAQSISGGRS